MSQWYYVSGNHKMGPISSDQMQYLIAENEIRPDTLIWREGMSGWSPASDMILQGVFRRNAGDTANAGANESARRIEEIHGLFRFYWISFAVAFISLSVLMLIQETALQIIAENPSESGGIWTEAAFYAAIFAVSLSIPWGVAQFVLLYQLWRTIQGDGSRTTPGKAVGYLFIPVYNFYWIFVAYLGLAKDMNAYARRHNVPNVYIHEGIVMAMCISVLLGKMPLFAGAMMALHFASMLEIKTCAIGILRARISQ